MLYKELTDDQLRALAREAEWECNSDMWQEEGIESPCELDMSGYDREGLLGYFDPEAEVTREHLDLLADLED